MSLEELTQAVADGNDAKARTLTLEAVTDRIPLNRIIDEGLSGGMSIIARLFKEEQCYLPEVIMAARAMQAGLAVLEPELRRTPVKDKGTVVAGTVYEDMHDIGKNLVVMLLKGMGFNVIDLGMNVSPQRFVQSVRETKADVVAMSCLLTTTMMSMKKTIDALKAAEIRDQVKVIVGGQPITQSFADQIGADAYARSAGEVADVVKRLLDIQ